MNFVSQSGYLRGDAHEAWRPATAGRPAQRVLGFEMWNRDSRGNDVVHRVVVDDAKLVDGYGPRLLSGCTVFLHGEMISRPVLDKDVLKGYVREIRALSIEIPVRARAAEGPGESAAA